MYPRETTNRQDAHEVAAWAYEVQDDSLATKKRPTGRLAL